MVPFGLVYLHGFNLAHNVDTPDLLHHGTPGVYAKTGYEVADDLGYWRCNCEEYDADPASWHRRRMAAAKAAIKAESGRSDAR